MRWKDGKLQTALSGIRVEEIIAFGDDYVDIGMLELCGRGAAMGNAINEVKERTVAERQTVIL